MLTKSTERVDPRVTRTRKLILDAFKSLQAEKRFDDITIQDITSRATINRATFYAHFPDKYALLDERIRVGFTEFLEQRLSARAESADDFLRHLFLAVTDHWTALNSHCQQTYRLFESLVETQVKAQVRERVHAWLAQHHREPVARGQRLDLAAAIISSALYGAAMEWTKHARTHAPERFADEALPMIAASIAAVNHRLP